MKVPTHLTFIEINACRRIVGRRNQAFRTKTLWTFPTYGTKMGTFHFLTRGCLLTLVAFVRIVGAVHLMITKFGQVQARDAVLKKK